MLRCACDKPPCLPCSTPRLQSPPPSPQNLPPEREAHGALTAAWEGDMARLAATEASDRCHCGAIAAARKEMSFIREIKETFKV